MVTKRQQNITAASELGPGIVRRRKKKKEEEGVEEEEEDDEGEKKEEVEDKQKNTGSRRSAWEGLNYEYNT